LCLTPTTLLCSDMTEETKPYINYAEFLKNQTPLHSANEHHEQKLSMQDKIALVLTEKIGSFWFFVFCMVLVIVWTVWNVSAPVKLHFDDSQFNIWQYVSSAFQIVTMPLIMVVQQIQLQHANARSEFSYLAMERSIKENAMMIQYLEQISEQNERLLRKIETFEAKSKV